MQHDIALREAREFIKAHYQMVLATYGDHPWTSTLYYSSDDELNLYFLSNPNTIHCQQLAQNSSVAVAIADSPQPPANPKKGLQLHGRAEEITSRHKITHALSLWTKTLGVTDTAYSYEGMVNKLITGRMYKITPHQFKFFNEELWEEGTEPLCTVHR